MNGLYQENAYIKEFDAKIIDITKRGDMFCVILDKTYFYPTSGGQPNDLGFIDDAKVLDVQIENNQILHYIDKELPFNSDVHCAIDWERRFDHMQNHSGEHIVSGLIHEHFGYNNVGFHMGEFIQVDFDGVLTKEDINKIESLANEVIQKNIPIRILYPTKEEENNLEYRSKKEIEDKLRIVQIEDVDCCACCGTHVKTTGEIGIIKIISASKHKEGTRLEMLAGMRCFNYLRNIFDENHEISVLLSAPLDDTFAYVNKLKEDISKKNEEKKYFSELYLSNKNYSILEEGIVFEIENNIDKNILKKYANKLIGEENIHTVVIINKTMCNFEYIIMSKSVNLKEAIKEINLKLNGKGGGNEELVQGSFNSEIDDIQKVIVDILKSNQYLLK